MWRSSFHAQLVIPGPHRAPSGFVDCGAGGTRTWDAACGAGEMGEGEEDGDDDEEEAEEEDGGGSDVACCEELEECGIASVLACVCSMARGGAMRAVEVLCDGRLADRWVGGRLAGMHGV